MKRLTLVALVCLAAAVPAALAADGPGVGVYDRPAPGAVLIRNATVWTQGPDGILEGADVLIEDGRIAAVGTGLSAPGDAMVVDAEGMHVTPGLIDCHSHTAIRGGVNEGSDNVTSEVRIADVVDPGDVNLYRQLAGGLTVAHLLHGSANSIGGQDAVIKLRWDSGRDLLMDGARPGIKFALGENPKRSNFRRDDMPQRYPNTRMGVMESIRRAFVAAREYDARWQAYEALSDEQRDRVEPPRRDLRMDAIVEILRGERDIHSHSYRQDEILALIRVAEQFDVRIATLQHVLEGYKVADEIASHGAGASTFSDWWAYKLEAYDAIPHNGALMAERGVVVTFNSDSSELARRMNLEAAKAVRYGGMNEPAALDLVTRNAAIQLGIDDRVGSLEVGKDGDVVVWSGHPLSVYSIVEQTWVDGVRQFDRAADLASREGIAEERARLIAEARGDKAATSTDATTASTWKAPGAPRLAYRDRLAALGETVSVLHARVHTMTGDIIENGTVSFRDGVIVEVGADLPALPGATVLDATGLDAYPGIIDANSVVGLTEISSVAGSVDVAETGDINPEVDPSIAINPDSELIPVTRAAGITHVVATPAGGLVSGSSSLIRLDGWTWEDLVASSPVAMHVRWPSFRIRRTARFGPPPPSEPEQIRRRDERLERIRTLFADAEAYRRAVRTPAPEARPAGPVPRLEAMLPVLDGDLPVVVHAGEVRQIQSALKWAEEQDVRIVLAGSGDLWRVADELAARDVPVILTSVLALPRRPDEPYDVRFTEAAALHAAGVRFCIAGSGSTFGAANARNLPYHAAMAGAFGLPRDEAMRALTRYPAEILGLGDALGTLEPGKSASLVLVEGDPLEIRSTVRAVFIDGRAIEPGANKHDRLYERYRDRPAAP